VVYIAGPPLYLLFGVTPVKAYSPDYFAHALPYLLACQALFTVTGWRMSTWRGQQYSLSLFPLWIEAVWSAVANVAFRRDLAFKVTPKVAHGGPCLRLVWPQLTAMVLLSLSVAVGLGKLLWEPAPDRVAILANLFWACYLLTMLSVIVVALRYRPGLAAARAAHRHGAAARRPLA